MTTSEVQQAGKVWLVGAGPGDPGLLTLRGAEVLADADLVLYDGLVNPLLLQMAKGNCERTARARRGSTLIVPQNEINERLISAARAGLKVVRLKGGDPCIFGRGSEESAALQDAGIEFEIVPGITAATAAAEYAGFSFTHRDQSSAVALVTGQEADDRSPRLDFESLAKFPGTLVFYMGLSRIAELAARLVEYGMSGETPTAVISEATLPSQRVLIGRLSSIAAAAVEAKMRPPSLIVVGATVEQRGQKSWFEKLPLFGRTIMVMRPAEQCTETALRISRAGGRPVVFPLISIEPIDDEQMQRVLAVLPRLHEFSWLVWTSVNGVHAFFRALFSSSRDVRAIAGAKLACIGPATAAALREYSLQADLVPRTYRGEALAQELAERGVNGPVAWFRADRGREVIPEILQNAGIELESIVVYRNCDAEIPEGFTSAELERQKVDWVCLTSPSIARRFAAALIETGGDPGQLSSRIACISPVTAAAAVECGLQVHLSAEEHTLEGLLAAIQNASE